MPSGDTQLVDYASFGTPPSSLFRDYVRGAPAARGFFAGGFDLRDLAAAAERSLMLSRPRAELAQALAAAQQARGASRAAARASELVDPRSVAVVTGQQACLFGGPLLVLYKALAVLDVAQRLAAERGAPAVPIFWVASTDHDFAEIRSFAHWDAAARLRTLEYAPHAEPAGQPAARIILDDTISTLIDTLDQAWPASAARDATVARIRAAYRPGVSLSEAFARLLSAYLPELVVLDAADLWLARLALPVLEREISEASPSSRLATQATARLQAAGYHAQVTLRPEFLNLFVYAEDQRRALARRGDALEVRGTALELAPAEAVSRMRQAPADWSAGALLRPLVQDHVLPTAAYVAGPAEIAYHAQIGECYAHFGIPRPALVPRPSLTLVEPAQARLLESETLSLAALDGDIEPLLTAWARASYPQVDEAFERARTSLRTALSGVEAVLASLDPTLAAACDATVGRALHPIEALHEKAERVLRKRDAARADRLRRGREALFPGGIWQERVLGWLDLLARHGPGALEHVRAHIDVGARGHQVLHL